MCKLGIIEESVSDIAVLKELMRLLAKHRDTIYKEVCPNIWGKPLLTIFTLFFYSIYFCDIVLV